VSQRSRRLRLVRAYLHAEAADAPSLRSLLKIGRHAAPPRRGP